MRNYYYYFNIYKYNRDNQTESECNAAETPDLLHVETFPYSWNLLMTLYNVSDRIFQVFAILRFPPAFSFCTTYSSSLSLPLPQHF